MDKLEIGVALIRRIEKRIHWLGKLDSSRKQIDFVIAERLEKESWRETILREVAWELQIERSRDFIVSNMAQLNFSFEAVLPGQLDVTKIACAFYNVELYGRAGLEQVDRNQEFIWLTSTEICDGVSDDGIPLNPLFVMLNNEADVIQHWETDAIQD